MRRRFPMRSGIWPWIGKAVFVGLSGWFWVWLAGPPDPKLNVYVHAGLIRSEAKLTYGSEYAERKKLASPDQRVIPKAPLSDSRRGIPFCWQI